MNQFTPQGVTAKILVQPGLLATLRVASDFHDFRWCRSSLAQPPANGCEAFGFKKSVKLFPFQCTRTSVLGSLEEPWMSREASQTCPKDTCRYFVATELTFFTPQTVRAPDYE